MKKHHKITKIIVLILLFTSCIPIQSQAKTVESSYQVFKDLVSKELNAYIKKSGGTISLEYQDLITDETFQMKHTTGYMAASTIKLPLAMYIMELADQGKIDLAQKLTYKKHHYIGGSGVIQKDKKGTTYTIQDLVKKAMIYSDNIAYNMLKEKVGQKNYVAYMKNLGASYSSPNALDKTSAQDLVLYAKHLYDYSQKSANGEVLVGYLQQTIFNETIPKGVEGLKTAHKVGMIPMYKVSNDVAIVYDQNPFALAVMTNGLTYEKSKKVIADISTIIFTNHIKKNKVTYVIPKQDIPVYLNEKGDLASYTLKKGFNFHVISSNGQWLGIELGQSTAYIKKNDVNSYSSAPIIEKTTTLAMDLIAETIIDTPILKTNSSENIVLAQLLKGTKIHVKDLGNGIYATLIGNRLGYIQSTNLEIESDDF